MSEPAEQSTIDHLVFASPDLESGVRHVEALLGVSLVSGGRHLGRGTRNMLIGLGPRIYLEVVGVDTEQPTPELPRWFGIDSLERPRLVTWCARHPDPTAASAEARERGFDLGAVEFGSRALADGGELGWRFTDPRADRAGGVLPFLIDWGESPHPAEGLPAPCRLESLELRHPEAERLQPALAALVRGVVVRRGTGPSAEARIRCPNGVVTLS